MTRPSPSVVVSYSRGQFDPNQQTPLKRHTSAGSLAEAVYLGASTASSAVTYIDANKPWTWPELTRTTHVIGIEANFDRLVNLYLPRKSLLFAVNQEARLSISKQVWPLEHKRLPSHSLLGTYDLSCRNNLAPGYADEILLVGDLRTYGTYLKAFKASAIQLVPYSYGNGYSSGDFGESVRRRILFPSSALSIRKGSDFIRPLCELLQAHGQLDFLVTILGNPVNNYWRQEVKELIDEFGPLVDFRGWIEVGSPSHFALLNQTACAVVPSREEGMVGAALEMLRFGVPVFATLECGLGPRPLRFTIDSNCPTDSAQKIINFLDTLASSSPGEDNSSSPWWKKIGTEHVSRSVARFIDHDSAILPTWVCRKTNQLGFTLMNDSRDNTHSTWEPITDLLEEAVDPPKDDPLLDLLMLGQSELLRHPDTRSIALQVDSGLADSPESNVVGSTDQHSALLVRRARDKVFVGHLPCGDSSDKTEQKRLGTLGRYLLASRVRLEAGPVARLRNRLRIRLHSLGLQPKAHTLLRGRRRDDSAAH